MSTLDRARELVADLAGVAIAAGWAPYDAGELWPVQMTGRGRYVVLGGPGGRLDAMPLWQWRAMLDGRRRVVWRERATGVVTVAVISDARKTWRPLFTFDPRRASVDAAYAAVFRRR